MKCSDVSGDGKAESVEFQEDNENANVLAISCTTYSGEPQQLSIGLAERDSRGLWRTRWQD